MAFSSQPLHRYQEKHRRNVPLGRQSPLPNARHLQMNPQVTPMEVLLRKSQLCATKGYTRAYLRLTATQALSTVSIWLVPPFPG